MATYKEQDELSQFFEASHTQATGRYYFCQVEAFWLLQVMKYVETPM